MGIALLWLIALAIMLAVVATGMADRIFQRGDAVSICSSDGRDIARGLTSYSNADAKILQGQRSEEIEKLLGYAGRDEIVHRDNLVLLDR